MGRVVFQTHIRSRTTISVDFQRLESCFATEKKNNHLRLWSVSNLPRPPKKTTTSASACRLLPCFFRSTDKIKCHNDNSTRQRLLWYQAAGAWPKGWQLKIWSPKALTAPWRDIISRVIVKKVEDGMVLNGDFLGSLPMGSISGSSLEKK